MFCGLQLFLSPPQFFPSKEFQSGQWFLLRRYLLELVNMFQRKNYNIYWISSFSAELTYLASNTSTHTNKFKQEEMAFTPVFAKLRLFRISLMKLSTSSSFLSGLLVLFPSHSVLLFLFRGGREIILGFCRLAVSF